MNGRQRTAFFATVLCCFGNVMVVVQAELPENRKQELESRIAKHAEECAEAKQEVLSGFEKQISLSEKNKKLNAELRISLIDALKAEKERFVSTEYVPFSPSMRAVAARYLAKVRASEQRLINSYDLAIKALTGTDNDGAEKLIQEKNKVPQVVGKWECQGANFGNGQKFTWILYTDFTVNRFNNGEGANPKFWSFSQNALVITNISPASPKGGFKDVCTVHPNGRQFNAKNQLGGAYVGELVE